MSTFVADAKLGREALSRTTNIEIVDAAMKPFNISGTQSWRFNYVTSDPWNVIRSALRQPSASKAEIDAFDRWRRASKLYQDTKPREHSGGRRVQSQSSKGSVMTVLAPEGKGVDVMERINQLNAELVCLKGEVYDRMVSNAGGGSGSGSADGGGGGSAPVAGRQAGTSN